MRKMLCKTRLSVYLSIYLSIQSSIINLSISLAFCLYIFLLIELERHNINTDVTIRRYRYNSFKKGYEMEKRPKFYNKNTPVQ